MVDAFQFSGFEGVKGEILGTDTVAYPFLADMRALWKDISAAMTLASAGDNNNLAADMGKAGMEIAARIRESDQNLMINLVGNSMERSILNELNAFDLIPGQDQFVFERQEAISSFTDSIKEATKVTDAFSRLNDAQFGEYFRRLRKDGEFKAMKWLATVKAGE